MVLIALYSVVNISTPVLRWADLPGLLNRPVGWSELIRLSWLRGRVSRQRLRWKLSFWQAQKYPRSLRESLGTVMVAVPLLLRVTRCVLEGAKNYGRNQFTDSTSRGTPKITTRLHKYRSSCMLRAPGAAGPGRNANKHCPAASNYNANCPEKFASGQLVYMYILYNIYSQSRRPLPRSELFTHLRTITWTIL